MLAKGFNLVEDRKGASILCVRAIFGLTHTQYIEAQMIRDVIQSNLNHSM